MEMKLKMENIAFIKFLPMLLLYWISLIASEYMNFYFNLMNFNFLFDFLSFNKPFLATQETF